MADVEQRSTNFVHTLLVSASTGVKSDGPVSLWADKTTHRLLVDAGTITTSSATAGLTGAAVPTSADYIGISIGGTLTGLAAGQATMANSIPVVLASNQASIPVTFTSQTVGLVAGSAIVGKVTTDQTTHGTTDLVAADITKVGGAAITLGSKTSANSYPVVIASDQGTISTNVAQMNGVTVLMGNGTTGTGSLRVTLASDNSAVAGLGAGATGSAVPSNATYKGINPITALGSAATAGNLTGAVGDKYGRQLSLVGTIRDLRSTQTTTISSSTSETTIVTAGGAGVFNDLVMVLFTNTSATAVRVDIRDTTAGSVLGSVYIPAGDMRGFSIASEAIPQTGANTNWTAQCSASVADVRIYAVFNKNK